MSWGEGKGGNEERREGRKAEKERRKIIGVAKEV